METYSRVLGGLGLALFYSALFFNAVWNGYDFVLAFFGGVALMILGYEMASENRARWVLYRVGLVAAVLFGANVAAVSAAGYFGGAGTRAAQLQTASEICASEVDSSGRPLRLGRASTSATGALGGSFTCADGSRHAFPTPG